MVMGGRQRLTEMIKEIIKIYLQKVLFEQYGDQRPASTEVMTQIDSLRDRVLGHMLQANPDWLEDEFFNSVYNLLFSIVTFKLLLEMKKCEVGESYDVDLLVYHFGNGGNVVATKTK